MTSKRKELPNLINRIEIKGQKISHRFSFVSSISGTPFSIMDPGSFVSLEMGYLILNLEVIIVQRLIIEKKRLIKNRKRKFFNCWS